MSTPRYETLPTALLLAVVGGFLDSYTFFTRGGVFANAQTGNTVRLSMAAAQGNFLQASYYLIPISAFTLGVFVTECLRARFDKDDPAKWRRLILLLETGILVAVGLLPPTVPDPVVTVTISFLCSMQVNSFRQLEGMVYTTTMCTGNLRSFSCQLWLWLFAKDRAAGLRARRYLMVLLSFCTGAILGVPFTNLFGGRSVWFCSLILLTVWGRITLSDPSPGGAPGNGGRPSEISAGAP